MRLLGRGPLRVGFEFFTSTPSVRFGPCDIAVRKAHVPAPAANYPGHTFGSSTAVLGVRKAIDEADVVLIAAFLEKLQPTRFVWVQNSFR